MPPSPPNFSNTRRQDSLAGGQMLLLAVAVLVAAAFSFLYITNRPDADPPVIQPPAVGGPESPITPQITPVTASHEPTSLTVEQVLIVQPRPTDSPEKILVRTPAMYASGTLQWSPEQIEAARELQSRLAAVLRHQEAIDRELARLEGQWKSLIDGGLPTEVLLPDSPSLPVPTRPTSQP